MRILKTELLLILVVFLISACLRDPAAPDMSKGPAGPVLTALATLKVVDDSGVVVVVDYNLQTLSGIIDQQSTDVNGIAVMTLKQNGDNSLENRQGFSSPFMDTFVYLRPTGNTDFTANPIMAPSSNGSPLGVPDNWCTSNHEVTTKDFSGFLRVYKSFDGTPFVDLDVLTVKVNLFRISDGAFITEYIIGTGADLATPTTVGLSYIDIWEKSGVTMDSSGHRNIAVQAFSFSDTDKTALAEVTLNGVTRTIEFAPCGAFIGGVLSIVYF